MLIQTLLNQAALSELEELIEESRVLMNSGLPASQSYTNLFSYIFLAPEQGRVS